MILSNLYSQVYFLDIAQMARLVQRHCNETVKSQGNLRLVWQR